MKIKSLILSIVIVGSGLAALQAQAYQTTTTTEETITITSKECSADNLMSSNPKADREISKTLDNIIDSYPELDDDVGFSVNDGVVTLRGEVERESEKTHAEVLASKISGVSQVDNRIRVDD